MALFGPIAMPILRYQALRSVWSNGRHPLFNNTKSYIGHAMGAAGLRQAGADDALDVHDR